MLATLKKDRPERQTGSLKGSEDVRRRQAWKKSTLLLKKRVFRLYTVRDGC